ncbi:MAG: complement resistance protein TraT, partial [Citrobacter sp.]
MSLKKIAVVGMVVAAMTLTGCGAMTTAVKKR